MMDTVTVFVTARMSCRLLSITSYQRSVGPWIGRPGVAELSNEKAIMKTIGRYRNAISAKNQIRSVHRIAPA